MFLLITVFHPQAVRSFPFLGHPTRIAEVESQELHRVGHQLFAFAGKIVKKHTAVPDYRVPLYLL